MVTSSIRKVVVPKNSRPFGRLHSQVTLVAIPPRVQQVDIVMDEGLEKKKKVISLTVERSDDLKTKKRVRLHRHLKHARDVHTASLGTQLQTYTHLRTTSS